MDEVWVNMVDVDDDEYEEVYDPIRIKIQDKDKTYLDVGLKALNALQGYTGTFERMQFGGFRVVIAVEKIRVECYG